MIPLLIVVSLLLIAGYAALRKPSIWDRAPNTNYMDGKTNSSQRLVGKFDTEQKCADACAPFEWCNFYTWYDGSDDNVKAGTSGECWGLVNRIQTPIEAAGVFSAAKKVPSNK